MKIKTKHFRKYFSFFFFSFLILVSSSKVFPSAEIFLDVNDTDIITSMSFSPDGKWIASGSADNTVKIRNVQSNSLIRDLKGHADIVTSVNFSPDGKWIASGGRDKTVKIWDAHSGKLHHDLIGHTDSVTSVSFSPDGKWIASGSMDKTVKIWDPNSGNLLHDLIGHTGSVTSVSFSPDGKWIASGGMDKMVKIWDPNTGKLLHDLKELKDQLQDANSSETISDIKSNTSGVLSVSFDPDGKWIASGGMDKMVKIWDPNTGKLLHDLIGHTDSVTSVSFSPDGKWIASGGMDKMVKIWDPNTGKLLYDLIGHTDSVNSVSFSPDGVWIASISWNKIKIWYAESGKLYSDLIGNTDSVFSVVFDPDGKRIASGGMDKTVKIWDPHTGKRLHNLKGHNDFVFSVGFSPDGKWIASGSRDKMVKTWDAHSGKLLHDLIGHTDSVTSVSFDPDGKWIASGGRDKMVKIWDPNSGKLLHDLVGHTSGVTSVSFSPDGKWIASGGWDKTVKIWDPNSGKLLHDLIGHNDSVTSVSFSPDGKQIASGGMDNTVKIWDLNTGEWLNDLGHTSIVLSVSFDPDGKWIASGGMDNTVKIWNAHTGKCLNVLGHTSIVLSVSFSPDGKRIASGGMDNTVKIWDINDIRTHTSQWITMAFLPEDQWLIWHNKTLFYNASSRGERFAKVRFDDHDVLPLMYYRRKLKRPDVSVAIASEKIPEIKPKKKFWLKDTFYNWQFYSLELQSKNKIKFLGFYIITILSLIITILSLITIAYLIVSGFISVLLRHEDPLEISRQFFSRIGFKRVESLSDRLLLLHPETGQMPGMVLHWQGEQDRSEWMRVIKENTKTFDQKVKLYLIYKGQRPSAKNMQDLREELRCEVIPITSFRLEKSMHAQNDKKILEELKGLEEPFLTRIDPYAESKPIHDPTWFYGRDEFMKRIPGDLAQGQHIGVFGLRKVGKTSLIQQIRQHFVYTPTVYIDCQAFFPKAEIYFEEILKQLNTELGKLGVKGLLQFESLESAEDFQKTFLFIYEKWKQSGHLGPFLIIMDEIDKFFPDMKIRDSESVLSEYVCFFKVLRGLAQTYQCLVTMVIAYRPDVNRKNLLSPSIGENPMFKSFLEEYIGFLEPLESTAMIQEIGGWKDILWEKDAAQRAFYYCGGHPLITRYFASDACEKGTLKYVDLKRVEDTAEKIQKTFHKNDIGNYYNEGVWALMNKDEKKVISLICQAERQGISEVQIPLYLENALTNLEQFGLVENRHGKLCFTARLFDKWLQRRSTYEFV